MKTVEPPTGPRLVSGWWWIPDVTWTLLRLAAATLLLWHGVQEHFGLFFLPGTTWQGAPLPYTEAWYAASVELVGGALLAVGLFTRAVALALLALLAVAYFTASGARGLWMLRGEELIVIYGCVLLVLASIGAGPVSVDGLTERLRARSTATMVPLSSWVMRQYRRRELSR